MKQISYNGYRSPPEIIQQAICSGPATGLLSSGNSRDAIRRSGGRREQSVLMDAVLRERYEVLALQHHRREMIVVRWFQANNMPSHSAVAPPMEISI